MKGVLRTLLLWFLLAGVPLQGFASATMLLCGPQAADPGRYDAARAQGHHDHAAMLAAQHGATGAHPVAHDGGTHHGTDAFEADRTADPAGHAGHAKCASAGACCTGAPLAPALPAAPPAQDGRYATVPFVPAAPAAVDLAGLERPPRSTAA